MAMGGVEYAFQQFMADSCTVVGHEQWLAGSALSPAVGTKTGWATGALAHHPTTANRKDLSNKAIGRFAAEISSKFGIFRGPNEASQRDLTL